MKDITPEGIKKQIEEELKNGRAVEYKEILMYEDLRKQIEDCFYGKAGPELAKRVPSVTCHEWGEGRCRMWKIDSGAHIMWTNDAGKEQFDKIMLEEGKKFLEK